MAEMKKKLIVIGAFSLLSAIWGVWIILKFSFFGAVAENSDSLQKDWELECSNGHSLNIEINYAGMNQNYRTVDIYCKNYAGESSPPIKCQFDTHSEILYTKDSNGLTFLSNGNPKGECTFTCCEKVKLKIVKSTELRKTKNGIPQNGYVEIK